ncbi:hypothetical protein [Chitinophaga sp. HK235]|uniref:hypothetical protein n=1 Tax=Chitinophaga sp. HK235 TaxID=2952571 RepID=UPI001BAE4C32|nr:hypothetical protein [Chitinophaga sp. HK235]
MVENKHSVNTVLSFGAKSVNPDILEQLLVGRSDAANYLFNAVKAIAEYGNNQQILVIGQRGMGKTHLIRILYHRCQEYITQNKLAVAYFSEEEYGVSNYFDFLIRILYAFIRWDETNQDFLKAKLEILQNTPDTRQTALAEQIIDEYRGERPLLILTENFGDILNDIGLTEQGKLRAWLYTHKRINIIATNQSISDDFDREDRPFYGFFNLYYLKPLSFKDSLNYLVSLAKLDDRSDVVKHLKNKGKSQVRAIHQLVKGNHRLLVTFYQFLKSDTLAKLSNHFLKTINDLKPYYETFIRYLPPQQQKILRYVALAREPQQGTSIQKHCFIDQSSLSKQLSELVRKRLLESIPNPNDKRNRLYDINEPLLRISIEVGEHREGITALFVDFLALYYDESELQNKISRFSDLLKDCGNTEQQREFQYEIIAIEKAIKKKHKSIAKSVEPILNQALLALRAGQIEDAEQQINTALQKHNHPIMEAMLGIFLACVGKNFEANETFKRIPHDLLVQTQAYAIWGTALAILSIDNDDVTLFEESQKKFELADIKSDEYKNIHYVLGKALIHFGEKQDNKEKIWNGITELSIAADLEQGKNTFHRLYFANQLLIWSIKEEDRESTIKADELFSQLTFIDPQNSEIYTSWGCLLSFANALYPRQKFGDKAFHEKFSILTPAERLITWKQLARFGILSLLKKLSGLFIADFAELPEEMAPVAVGWITNILANRNLSLTKDDIKKTRTIVNKIYPLYAEIKLMETFINTYESVKLDNDQSAIFKLPKEQREFFENEILNRNKLSDLS